MVEVQTITGRNWRVLVGDVLDGLKLLPDESVQCCVTSPPYFGLRDYSACACSQQRHASQSALEMCRTIVPGASGQSSATDPRCKKEPDPNCKMCGGTGKIIGTESQIGLEKTPDEFIARLVDVFREVKRVLRADGTCWVNMGDSYNAYNGNRGETHGANKGHLDIMPRLPQGAGLVCGTLKPKDLMGMPWRLAFALQSDGWYLRQDIIWHKRSPMPESVNDRCTKAHEYIFLLTKSARYFYDAEAVKEPCSESTHARLSQDVAAQVGSERANGGGKTNGKMKAVCAGSTRKLAESGSGTKNNGSFDAAMAIMPTTRNLRSVWSLSSEGFAEAHFATFPSEIPRRCIKAGTSEKGCCPKCGAPWVRVTEKTAMKIDRSKRTHEKGRTRTSGTMVEPPKTKTTGWQPSCDCEPADPVPCVVLDPFSGSGTTGMVATELGREYIGCELNPEYAEMSRRRIESWRLRDVEKAAPPLPGQKELFA